MKEGKKGMGGNIEEGKIMIKKMGKQKMEKKERKICDTERKE